MSVNEESKQPDLSEVLNKDKKEKVKEVVEHMEDIPEEIKENNNLLNENLMNIRSGINDKPVELEDDIKIEDLNNSLKEHDEVAELIKKQETPIFKGKDPMENELNDLVKPYVEEAKPKKPKGEEDAFA
jgi:hypothetical protein